MLEITKAAVALEEEELLELARIVHDQDRDAALRFLKRSLYDKVQRSQLKCGGAGPLHPRPSTPGGR